MERRVFISRLLKGSMFVSIATTIPVDALLSSTEKCLPCQEGIYAQLQSGNKFTYHHLDLEELKELIDDLAREVYKEPALVVYGSDGILTDGYF